MNELCIMALQRTLSNIWEKTNVISVCVCVWVFVCVEGGGGGGGGVGG